MFLATTLTTTTTTIIIIISSSSSSSSSINSSLSEIWLLYKIFDRESAWYIGLISMASSKASTYEVHFHTSGIN